MLEISQLTVQIVTQEKVQKYWHLNIFKIPKVPITMQKGPFQNNILSDYNNDIHHSDTLIKPY